MPPKTLTVTEAVRRFSEVVNRVAYRHESFVLRKGTKAVAELRPVPAGGRLGDLPALLRSLPPLSPDEAKDFLADIRKARKALPRKPPRDPWAS